MSIQATAEALAQEAMPEAATPEAQTEDQELEAIYDAALESPEKPEEAPQEAEAVETAEQPEDQENDASDAVEEPDDEPEEVTPAPSELPKAIRDAWKDIPEGARTAFLESQREMSRKLGEQGRLIQGIAPIRDVLVDAAQKIPALAQMRPQEVAQEVMQLAQISGRFKSDPVNTMMGLIRQHGLEQAVSQALSGQQPQQTALRENQLLQKIDRLERQLTQVASPEYVRQHVEQYTTQTQVASTVNEFASQAEHWADVEADMPRYIAAVQAMQPNASAMDTLRDAYELAVSRQVPSAKAKTTKPAPQAAPVPDPEQVKAAQKAKSINARSATSGKPRALTEEQELARVWEEMRK